jgi:2-methylcitrate dehydratase PrpD
VKQVQVNDMSKPTAQTGSPATEVRGGPIVERRVTEELAAFCAGTTADRLPAATFEAARRLLLDFTGVALRGSRERSSHIVAETVERLSPPRNEGSQLIGYGTRNSPEYAAMVNGASLHGLELDDIHPVAAIHPGAAVFPAALAAGEAANASGRDLLAAVVIGYEVSCRLSRALVPSEHGGHGFHSTATCGVFGAVAAVSRLYGLSADQLVNAFGIAGSQAAGSIEYLTDGAWTKRLHPGWAAHAGIIAVELARGGFTGPRRMFEGKNGFLRSYSDRPRVEAVLEGLGENYQILGVAVKPHAACRYSQAAIDSVLELVRDNDVQPQDIDHVTVGTFKGGIPIVAEPLAVKRRPRSVVDAQFSIHFAVATAATRRRVAMPDYRPECLASAELHALMDRVECVHQPDLDAHFPELWPATVAMVLRDGRKLHGRKDVLHGDPEDPLSWDELVAKADGLISEFLPEKRRGEIVTAIKELQQRSVRSFTELLSIQ